ncbi:MAG TPA: D-alanyl-D-alanine carboxypeptidase [Thermomicrobiales bacterium]|nr:D-alanyl-D-alanine carboxypeptidase [Thermomicrobiales bacterium]
MSPATVNASIENPAEGPAVAAQIAPEITARSALAVDLTSGLQLFNHEGDARVAPASTMKIVTVLAARGVLPPGEQVTVTEADLVLPDDYSKMGLENGDVVTVEALFYGALLSSGGDAALALARVAGKRLDPSTSDPVARFMDEVNRYAESINMHSSHFSNPVGIDAPDHYTTARDLIRATERLLADPLLARITATPEVIVTVGGPNARELYLVSTNQFVLDGTSIGGKTGTTDLAGECLINVTQHGHHTVVSVVMGSDDRYVETQALMANVEERYRFVPLGVGSSVLGVTEELALQGLAFPVGTTVLMTPRQADALTYTLQLTGDRSPNGKAGVVTFMTGGRVVRALPVHTVD